VILHCITNGILQRVHDFKKRNVRPTCDAADFLSKSAFRAAPAAAGTRASVVIVRRRRTRLRSHYTTDREPGEPCAAANEPFAPCRRASVPPRRRRRLRPSAPTVARPTESDGRRQEVASVVATVQRKKYSTSGAAQILERRGD